MDAVRAYRRWLWRRLALLFPSQAVALGVNFWIAFRGAAASWIKVACISIAATLGLLIAYLLFQTLRCAGLHRRSRRPEAHLLRRELKPLGALTAASLLLILALVQVPSLFENPREPLALRTSPLRISRSPIHANPQPTRPELRDSTAEEPPATLLVAADPPGRPQELPLLPREPLPLELADRDFEFPPRIEVPYVPKARDVLAQEPGEERGFPRFRGDLNVLFASKADRPSPTGLPFRPLPDERNADAWPPPESRLDGVLFVGRDRVPALAAGMDLPCGRDDSIQALWLGALLPRPEGSDESFAPNWHHFSLAYVRRLGGFSRQATIDFSASAGLSADLLGSIEGLSISGHHLRVAPYFGVSAALWQDGPAGLLLQLGQSIPLPALGPDVQVTDVKAEIRVDLSQTFSLHAGYSLLVLRFKQDSDRPLSRTDEDPLNGHMSGAFLGLDVRF